jgi:hypothetical protein
LTLASLLALAAASASPWSAPAALGGCPAVSAAAGAPAARVVFPSDRPSHGTGPGAVLWSGSSRCPGGQGARVAVIGAGDAPGASALVRSATGAPLAPRGALLAGGAPHGRILIAGSSPHAPNSALVVQGGARGPFSALAPVGGASAPMALATAYLGDVALASPPAGGSGGLRVRVERYFAHNFVRSVSTGAPAGGPVRGLTVAMDFRSEALAVWAQDGTLYAWLVPNKGAPRPVERLARVDGRPTIAALLSDDDRAIVAWSQQHGAHTSVYLDRSAAGVRFGRPQLLERFHDPDHVPAPAASPSLVRLSSESVMLAWAGASAGHWVVRTAPVDLSGEGATGTIAAPGTDALLAHLAAGPANDALVLWTQPPRAGAGTDGAGAELFAARGFDDFPADGTARTVFGAAERVAPLGPVADATAAFDPDSDRAVAVWQGEAGAVDYSIRAPGAGL